MGPGLSGYILYGVLWIVLLATIFWRPVYGIFLLVPLLPLQALRARLNFLPLGAQFIDLMLVAVILGQLIKREHIFVDNPIRKYLLFYIGFTYVSLWWGALYLGGEYPFWFNNERLSDWKNYIVLLVLYFLILSTVKTAHDLRVLLAVMCGAVLIIVKNFQGGVSGADFSQFSYESRYGGIMGFVGANGLSAFSSQVLAFSLAMRSKVDIRALKWLCVLLIIGATYCVLFTFSRGGYLAALAAFLIVALVSNRMLLIPLALFLLSWQTLVPGAVRERVMMTRTESGELEASAADRVTLWEDAMQLVAASPVFGTGYHTYAFMSRVGASYRSDFHYRDTHNYYLKVMVETGAIGMIVFLLLLGKLFGLGFRLYRTATDSLYRSMGLGFCLWMVAASLVNLFGDRWTYVQISAFTWALAACVVRAQSLSDQAAAEEKTDSGGEPDQLDQSSPAILPAA